MSSNYIKRYVYEVDFRAKALIKICTYTYNNSQLIDIKEDFVGKYYGKNLSKVIPLFKDKVELTKAPGFFTKLFNLK